MKRNLHESIYNKSKALNFLISEAFLYCVWQYQMFYRNNILTVRNETLQIVTPGTQNTNSGPDFFNSKIVLDNQLWAGNIEIHVKSSDWYLHQHEKDSNYDSVLLHVVWEYDLPVFDKNNNEIPVLELKNYVNNEVLENYIGLFETNSKWILCQNSIANVNLLTIENWLTSLYFERLERKVIQVNELLAQSKNDWEQVLFLQLAKYFGSSQNQEAFLRLCSSFDFKLVRKLQNDVFSLEALLFGQAGLLKDEHEDAYYSEIKDAYLYLKQKYRLDNSNLVSLQFFKIRPSSFPTIRLSQLANLYHKNVSLFAALIGEDKLQNIYKLFDVGVSDFWKTHYVFGKSSGRRDKKISKPFVGKIIINTILPLIYAYQKQQGFVNFDTIEKLLIEVPSENNAIVNKYQELGFRSQNALHSQGLLELKKMYCEPKRCLSCAIGVSLLRKAT